MLEIYAVKKNHEKKNRIMHKKVVSPEASKIIFFIHKII